VPKLGENTFQKIKKEQFFASEFSNLRNAFEQFLSSADEIAWVSIIAVPGVLKGPIGFVAHCVATIVTLSVASAPEETPGPDGFMIRLSPEIAKTP
jgi:hypothetical protein